MKALLVGLGGIGKNVYVPELTRNGFDVTTVDSHVREAHYPSISQLPNVQYDLGIIATPNYTHFDLATEAAEYCKNILVDKPGVGSLEKWRLLKTQNSTVHFALIKNNLYRYFDNIFEPYYKSGVLSAVEINWLNANRVPQPGGWFTDKSRAFGGVAYDLFPHLYCFMYLIFGNLHKDQIEPVSHYQHQRWNLQTVGETDYGRVDRTGIYNVCDYAEEFLEYTPWHNPVRIPITLRASWKEGRNDQTVRLYLKDGSVMTYEFGLCPSYAYGAMFYDTMTQYYVSEDTHEELDRFIHLRLEAF